MKPPNEFGFTNDQQWLEYVRAYRDAAVADGWSIEATYKEETFDRAARLRKDGFLMSILTRDNSEDHRKYRAERRKLP